MSNVNFVLVGNPHHGTPCICIEAQNESRSVGRLFASIEADGKIRLDRLGVDPMFRKQGVARGMFDEMLKEAKAYSPDKGIHNCYVYPVASSEMYEAVSQVELEAFYGALGFREATEGMWVKTV